ncbi:MAG TPA: sulfatase [Planctomycetota bacterium]|jgi:arylsulfatase A-like enzyme|nr:sulfatase [Planctomycetota bacterium]
MFGTRAFLVSLMALALPVCSPSQEAEEWKAPDVVVVLIDTLRPDHLGFYGHETETAPFLAEMAKQSAVFHRAYSTSSWTAPAVASLFTGLYPTKHGIVEGFMAFKRRNQRGIAAEVLPLNKLPEDVGVMADFFKKAGYQTFGIATNLNIGSEIGFNRAFDEWKLFRKDDAAKVGEQLEEWREKLDKDKPSFFYLHFMDPHMPYNKRAPWYEKQSGEMEDSAARYDSEIRFLDQELKKIFTQFGWDKEGLLVMSSDHGEEFGDHGGTGHEFQLHSELNRVLFTFRPPGGIEGRDIHTNVSIVDILPTTLATAGLVVPPGLDGQSLLPLIQGHKDAPQAFANRTLFAHRLRLVPKPAHLWAAIRGPWKLLFTESGPKLFNHIEDFAETLDLSQKEPEIFIRLLEDLKAFQELGFRSVEKVEIKPDANLLKELEALGYFEDEE